MIEYKKGCLIEAVKNHEVSTIIHQANCQNTMNSGVAKAIKEQFPRMWEVDQNTAKGDREKLGTISHVQFIENGSCKLGINLYGQYAYGTDRRHTDYSVIESGLIHCRALIDKLGYDWLPIGMPKLGCGLGGGDWDIVSKLVEQYFYDFNVIVYFKE